MSGRACDSGFVTVPTGTRCRDGPHALHRSWGRHSARPGRGRRGRTPSGARSARGGKAVGRSRCCPGANHALKVSESTPARHRGQHQSSIPASPSPRADHAPPSCQHESRGSRSRPLALVAVTIVPVGWGVFGLAYLAAALPLGAVFVHHASRCCSQRSRSTPSSRRVWRNSARRRGAMLVPTQGRREPCSG